MKDLRVIIPIWWQTDKDIVTGDHGEILDKTLEAEVKQFVKENIGNLLIDASVEKY